MTVSSGRDAADIVDLLSRNAAARAHLEQVARLGLPDCWIGAGFVRNAVWDVLHGRPAYTTPLNDVDVIFFDPADMGRERDEDIARRLVSTLPETAWSVKNQARMHLRNGDEPYRDTRDALSFWCETPTAIAARLSGGRVELMAPFGVQDLVGLIVRPTPHFASKLHIYRERLRQKNWIARWPKLRIDRVSNRMLTAPS